MPLDCEFMFIASENSLFCKYCMEALRNASESSVHHTHEEGLKEEHWSGFILFLDFDVFNQ